MRLIMPLSGIRPCVPGPLDGIWANAQAVEATSAETANI